MTTIIEDRQLNTELQELYLVSKQWLSNLLFLETEYDFLKKRFEEFSDPGHNAIQLEKINTVGNKQHALKLRIQDYSNQLEPLITQIKHPLNMNLVETYAQIEKELDQFSDEIHAVKNAVLELTKEQHKKAEIISNTSGKKSKS